MTRGARVRTLACMRLFLFLDPDWPAHDASPHDLVELVAPTIVTLHSRTQANAAQFGEELHARGLRVEVVPLQSVASAAKVHLTAAFVAGSTGELPPATKLAVLRLHASPVAVLRAREGALYDRVDAWHRFAEQSDLESIVAMLRGLYVAFPAAQDAIKNIAEAVTFAKRATASSTLTAAWMDMESTRIAHPQLAPWLAGPEKMLGAWVQNFAA